MITAVVVSHIIFSGDQQSEFVWGSGSLINSPAFSELVTLPIGDNEVPVPLVEGFVYHGVAIVPPNANVTEPVLKGATGEVGIPLSASHASVIQLGANPVSLILGVDDEIVGLRLVWF